MSRTRLIQTICGLFALTSVPQPVAAEDYPFSGQFWPALETADRTRIDLLCALSFLDQRSDGTWSVYHVDLTAFRASGAIRYHKLSEGACQYTPETKVETCVVSLDLSYPQGVGGTVYDVLVGVSDLVIETVMIEAASGWEAVMQEGALPEEGTVMNYLRCPFPKNALLSRISADLTPLSPDDINALRFPTEEFLADPDVAKLAKALAAE